MGTFPPRSILLELFDNCLDTFEKIAFCTLQFSQLLMQRCTEWPDSMIHRLDKIVQPGMTNSSLKFSFSNE